jgi:hypothetical protein
LPGGGTDHFEGKIPAGAGDQSGEGGDFTRGACILGVNENRFLFTQISISHEYGHPPRFSAAMP